MTIDIHKVITGNPITNKGWSHVAPFSRLYLVKL